MISSKEYNLLVLHAKTQHEEWHELVTYCKDDPVLAMCLASDLGHPPSLSLRNEDTETRYIKAVYEALTAFGDNGLSTFDISRLVGGGTNQSMFVLELLVKVEAATAYGKGRARRFYPTENSPPPPKPRAIKKPPSSASITPKVLYTPILLGLYELTDGGTQDVSNESLFEEVISRLDPSSIDIPLRPSRGSPHEPTVWRKFQRALTTLRQGNFPWIASKGTGVVRLTRHGASIIGNTSDEEAENWDLARHHPAVLNP